jgi:proliferating cell nuclear antigen PCNA
MLVTIIDKPKKDLFISVFQILKACSSSITVFFKTDCLYIQGMDKSHVCLFEVRLDSSWFDSYVNESDVTVCVSTHFFYNILSTTEEHHNIELVYDTDVTDDSIFINLLNSKDVKGSFNKYFKLPLCENEYSPLNITEFEYNAEFSISSKKMNDIVTQLSIFGDVMIINCSEGEEKIDVSSKGDGGEMTVAIPIDDLTEYAICEGETIDISYSLSYMQKMCVTTKLTSEIYFYISQEKPLKVRYLLGENSFFHFFIAPKI